MMRRKRLGVERERRERARRLAYQDALDIRIFEEELLASRSRKGGSNPCVRTDTFCQSHKEGKEGATANAAPAAAKTSHGEEYVGKKGQHWMKGDHGLFIINNPSLPLFYYIWNICVVLN